MRQRADVVWSAQATTARRPLMLARRGLDVPRPGGEGSGRGAARTERPFQARAPALSTSTGAYLLGLMPPELLRKLESAVPLLAAGPHYFLPPRQEVPPVRIGRRRDEGTFLAFFSEQGLARERGAAAGRSRSSRDVAPTWLEEPLSIEETAGKVRPPALRRVSSICAASPWGTIWTDSNSAATCSRPCTP